MPDRLPDPGPSASPSPSRGVALARLRAETRAQHERLEAAVGPPSPPTPAWYRRFLGRWWGFLVPIEEALAARPGLDAAIGLALPPRRKRAWLEADLAALGLGAAEIAALPLCTDLPPLDRAGEALGCLYVLEGSTLGGQLLARTIEAELPELAGATRFVRSYGPEVGPKWRGFLEALEAFSAQTPAAIDDVVRAGRETFAAFERWQRG